MNQDIDKYPFPNVGNNVFYKEFHVGNMLPQMGSTKGFDSELSKTPIEEVIDDTNKDIEDVVIEKEHSTNLLRKLYHVSETNLDGKVLKPRVPVNSLTKNGLEEGVTARVCFAPTIDKCLMALSQNLKDKEFYVHVPSDKIKYQDVKQTQVPDSKVTKEKWVTIDVKLKCIGKIKVLSAQDKPYKFGYPGHPDIAKSWTYKWNWEWIDKYDNVNECTEFVTEASFINDEGKKVPRICPKCGSPVGVFFQGEPVYLCKNEKCRKYFGCVRFPTKKNKNKVVNERNENDMINTENIADNMFEKFFNESANSPSIPDEIEPIVRKIESKGYDVKYASPGHNNTRFDNDRNDDGVINNKLVTTGRIIFARNYSFPNTPQGWEWKVLENGAKALYVKKYTYNKKMGSEAEAFKKWQDFYLSNLRDWANNLPKQGEKEKGTPDENFDS